MARQGVWPVRGSMRLAVTRRSRTGVRFIAQPMETKKNFSALLTPFADPMFNTSAKMSQAEGYEVWPEHNSLGVANSKYEATLLTRPQTRNTSVAQVDTRLDG